MDTRQRRHRLSTDGEKQPPRTPSPSSSRQKTRCPSCGQRQLTTVNVDGELLVSVCSGCNWGCRMGDSMNAESTILLLVDDDFKCERCRNNDVNRFDVESQHPDRLSVKCTECSSVVDIPLKNWENEGSDDDVGGGRWVAKVLRSSDDDRGSLRGDDDGGFVAGGEEVRDVGDRQDAGVAARPFNCTHCRNNEVNCFRVHVDAASGDLSMVTCLVCDHQKPVASFLGVECWHCGNSREELFERHADDCGRITQLRCFVCDKRLHLPGQPSPNKEPGGPSPQLPDPCGSSSSGHLEVRRAAATDASEVCPDWTKIVDLRRIRRGDHVARRKWYGVWHHAVVVDASDDRSLTVIHYNGGVPRVDGHFASVRLETIDVDPTYEAVYRIDYPAGATYPPDEVILRAGDRVGEAKYNPFTNNCEHFARWCKTGRSECGQVRTFRLACQNAILGQVLIPVPFLGGFIGCKYNIGNRISLAAIKRQSIKSE